jgi:hypothetical protein
MEAAMRSTMRTTARLFLGFAILAAAACGGGGEDATGPSPDPTPSADISGTYALAQVRTHGHISGGGSGLPVEFVDNSGDHLVFLSGTVTLGADGTFDMKVQVTFKGNPSELTDYGTYSVTSGSITFSSQKSTPRLSTGTVSGNQITAQSQFGSIPFEIDVVK